LEKSKAESEALLNFSLETMDRYHFDLGAKLADVPRAEHLRVEVLNQAKESLLHLYGLNPRREAVWEYLLNGFNKLGQAQTQVGDLAAAADSFQKAAAAADHLLAAHPDNLTHRINRAGAQFNAANVLERLGRTEEATRLRNEAGRAADEILADHPRHPGALSLGQTVNRRRLLDAYDTGDPTNIEAALRAQCDLDRRLCESEPEKAGHRLTAANDALHLVDFLGHRGKSAEADDLLSRAEKWTAELPNPNAAETRVLRGKLHECRGSLLQEQRKYAEADAEYREGLAINRALAADFPDSPGVLVREADSWTWIGLNWTAAGEAEKAKSALAQARDAAERLAKRFPKDQSIRQKKEFIEGLLGSLGGAAGGRPK
jgi:tetratricopeptide (TPR) repeat protein